MSQEHDPIYIELNNVKKPYIVEDIINVKNKVFSDVDYAMVLECDKEILDVFVYINGEQVSIDFRDNTVYFCSDDKYVFSGIIGLVQISLLVYYAEGESEWLYSEYSSVMIKASTTNKAIDSMLKYVYENQEDILHQDVRMTGIGKNQNERYDDFWSQIVLLEEIANAYENNYGYFMANCRTKLKKIEVLDSVEKIQSIDSKTLQYITQHPEYLKSAVSGIKYGKQYFMPTKTLMMQNQATIDIYENQVIMSFLEYILDEVSALDNKINKYIGLIQTDGVSEDGYIMSSHLLYVNAKEILLEFVERIDALKRQYTRLVFSYSGILSVRRISMQNRPEPTAIFMNLPEYNRIYTCILRWFGKQGYDFINERAILNFMSAPAIYESYVLIKLINQIKDMGYILEKSKNVTYPKKVNWKYKNNNYNNTFEFSDDNSRITLYYEPIIYDEDKSNINSINLYRNNSVSLSRETDEERQGRYYVPDFVIKYEENEKEQYLICDAKFSRKSKVKYILMPDLIFKYISSISGTKDSVSVKGLYVFYGLTEDSNNTESFYDRHIDITKRINPRVEMLPLSESVLLAEQEKNAVNMFRSVIDIFS